MLYHSSNVTKLTSTQGFYTMRKMQGKTTKLCYVNCALSLVTMVGEHKLKENEKTKKKKTGPKLFLGPYIINFSKEKLQESGF